MRSFAYPLLAAVAAVATAAPAFAQERAPFTGAHVEGILGGDRIQNGGHSDDLMYGIGAGYDMQMGGALVGIEAEASDSDNKQCSGAATVADPRLCAKMARDLYVGGRVGTVVGGRTLLYAKAGYTNARAKLTDDDGTDQITLAHTDLDGARVGAGAEYMVGPNAYLKAEYRYSTTNRGSSGISWSAASASASNLEPIDTEAGPRPRLSFFQGPLAGAESGAINFGP